MIDPFKINYKSICSISIICSRYLHVLEKISISLNEEHLKILNSSFYVIENIFLCLSQTITNCIGDNIINFRHFLTKPLTTFSSETIEQL
jgi:hypothetical protein